MLKGIGGPPASLLDNLIWKSFNMQFGYRPNAEWVWLVPPQGEV